MNRLISWIDKRFPLKNTWRKHLTGYYVPKNLNILYVFGALSMLVLFNQIVTGLWLTMFYTPSADRAFDSIQYIMRDVNFGWLLRYMHSTGASAFFIVVYLHMFRAILYGSYQKPRELLWIIGVIIFILLIMEAFFGYLLPWGQMSYWGAEVITSLFGSIPLIGDHLLMWIRGDFNLSNATLQRFFALHVVGVPLLFVLFVFLHVVALRKVGSNNPDGVEIDKAKNAKGRPLDGIPFHPYYTVKDLVGAIIFLIAFFSVVFFAPEMGGYFLEPDNFSPANPLVTPEHITPAWYLTPFYSMLRAIPNKLVGIMVLGLSILVLFVLPWLDHSPVRSMRYKGAVSKIFLWLFVFSFISLGYLGTVTVTPMRQALAQLFTVIYFAYFIIMPFYTRLETHKIPPVRIGQ